MSIMRWNPGGRMMTMNDMLDRFFEDPFSWGGQWRNQMAMPKVDVVESDDHITVKAEMPGFAPENVEARVEGSNLLLRGTYNQDQEKTEGQYHIQERQQGSFSRVVPLPMEVDTDKATAEFDNGVLTMSLPKRPGSQRKQINITTKTNEHIPPARQSQPQQVKSGRQN